MLAGGQGFHRQGSMGRHGGGYDDGIDARIGDQVVGAPGGPDARVALLHCRQPVRIQIADRLDRGSAGFRKTAYQVWTPIPVAHHSDTDHSVSSIPAIP